MNGANNVKERRSLGTGGDVITEDEVKSQSNLR